MGLADVSTLCAYRRINQLLAAIAVNDFGQLNPDSIGRQLKDLLGNNSPNSEFEVAVTEDDCAATHFPAGILVITSDYVNASPIGLELGISDFWDIGYYLVSASISDLAGSGAQPIAILLNIMWGREHTQAEFWQLMAGAQHAAQIYGASIIGGDTKLPSGKPALNAVAIGRAESADELFLQKQAKAGHELWVSGELGSCAAAVVGLGLGIASEAWQSWAHAAIRHPTVPLASSRRLANMKIRAGGIDISDGLGADLTLLAGQSNVGIELELDAIPVAEEVIEVADRLGVHPASFAFTVGGDLQFAVTVPADLSRDHLNMHRIGNLIEGCESAVTHKMKSYPMPNGGHQDARGLSFLDEIRVLLRGLPFNDHH